SAGGGAFGISETGVAGMSAVVLLAAVGSGFFAGGGGSEPHARTVDRRRAKPAIFFMRARLPKPCLPNANKLRAWARPSPVTESHAAIGGRAGGLACR